MTDALRPDGLPQPRTAFETAVVDFLVDLFEAYPTWGTDVGYHRVDDRWPDLTEAGRTARIATFGQHRARLLAFAADELSADEAVDPPPVHAARKAAEADIVPAHRKPRRLNGA